MTYEIEVTETLQRRIVVDADDEYAAIKCVRKLYKDAKVVLCAEDSTATEFAVVK